MIFSWERQVGAGKRVKRAQLSGEKEGTRLVVVSRKLSTTEAELLKVLSLSIYIVPYAIEREIYIYMYNFFKVQCLCIYIYRCLKESLETISFHLLPRVSGPQSRMVQECCVLVRDIIIWVYSHYTSNVYRNLLFQRLGRHTSSILSWWTRGGREGWREPQTLVLLDNISRAVMIWCWRDDSHAVTPRGEKHCKLESRRDRRSYFSMFAPCDIRTILVQKDSWKLSVQWTNEQINKHDFFENFFREKYRN